ncbi:MAG: aldolase [Peptococcaceae bacterium]|nr:aldolase [Peptococcaceae bacterium]
MLKIFQQVGRDLFTAGLNNSHSGNLSARLGDRLVITRRGSMLAHLEEEDLIETGLEKDDVNTPLASTEIGVHRAIYLKTPALAVVHAHPPHAVALSLLGDEIVPVDAEGLYLLPRVPVLSPRQAIASKELEETLPEVLREYRAAVVRGHGSFAAGRTLEEAYKWTASLQHSCRILCIARSLGRGPGSSK